LYYLEGKGRVVPLPAAAARYFTAAEAQRGGEMKLIREYIDARRTAVTRLNAEQRFAAEPAIRIQEKKLESMGRRVAMESRKNLRADYLPLLGEPAAGKVGWVGAKVPVVNVLGDDEMLVRLPGGAAALARGWPTEGLAAGAKTSFKTPAEVSGVEQRVIAGAAGQVFVLRPFDPDRYVRTVGEAQFLTYLEDRDLSPAGVLDFVRRKGHKPDAAGAAAVVKFIEGSAAGSSSSPGTRPALLVAVRTTAHRTRCGGMMMNQRRTGGQSRTAPCALSRTIVAGVKRPAAPPGGVR
jgi:hypothetical protein